MQRSTFRIVAAAFLVTASLSAHEIGTSRVSVLFPEGRTFDIELVTDAAALLEKLETVTGKPVTQHTSAAEMKTLLEGFDDQFRRRISVAFDGAGVAPEISYAVDPPVDAASAFAGKIRFTGPIPHGAQRFTWKFGWTFASYAMMLRSAPFAPPATQWLEGDETSKAFLLSTLPAPPTRLVTAWRYLRLGFTHILPNGLDHMLFVLGIFLLSGRPRSVLLQVSAFTVAHSITLGLSLYGLISVSPRIVEPAIALSIAYVAIENVLLSELRSWRVALVFAFGLLHGMGFAGALRDLGLPPTEFLTALVTFNLGVEAGQLSVIAAAFLLVGWHWSQRSWYRVRIVVPASAMIACTAVYWTIQRIIL